MNRELRAHQTFAIEQLRASLLSGKKRPMLSLPTGAGKTVIAASIVESALAKGKRVIFVVPAVTLVDQTVQRFFEEGIHDVGVIQAQHEMTDWTQPVQVASVQTLMRRKRLPEADLVVIDEAHRWFRWYGTWMAMDDWRRVPFVGLSATPWTRGLGKHYDDLVVVATTGQLIEQGYLSPFRVFAPAHPDLAGVRTVAGDYHEGELSDAMSKPELVADIVTTWLERGEGRPTLCFGVDRAHAQRIHKQFLAAGVASAYVDAFTDDDDRREIAARFAAGAVKVVCNVGVLTTGVDWDVRCIILARPTKSEMLYVQIVGRGLRTAPGKDHCTILDHSDTTLKLGFVTDIHHDSLDTGKPQEMRERQAREALPKECPKCAFVKPAKVHACPSCGFKPERMSAVEVKDGQLVELDGRRNAKARAASIEEKIDYMGQLRGYAAEHGYSAGWASHKFRERFRVWPNDGRVRNALAKPCGRAVRTWITSRNIAFAKGRQRAAAQ